MPATGRKKRRRLKRERPRTVGVVTLDFEWFCEANLKEVGLYRTVKHPSFEPLCLAFKIDGIAPVVVGGIWKPGEPCPEEFLDAIEEGCEFHAHNASAERLVWEHVMVPKYGWPKVPKRLWRCTAAKAAHGNLPRKLERACKALDLDEADAKDAAGHKVMLKLSKLNRGKRMRPTIDDPVPVREWRTPKQRIAYLRKLRRRREKQAARTYMYDQLYRYCRQDVHAETMINDLSPAFTERELAIWQLDQKINDRGVPVDLGLCQGANSILDVAFGIADARLTKITKNAVTGVNQVEKMTAFIRSRGIRKKQLLNLRKQTVADFLASGKCTDKVVLEVLDIKRRAGLASVKKMRAAYNWTDDDCRCRGTLNYYSASTGRWGGRGPQFQNMVRAKTPSEELLRIICEGEHEALLDKAKDVIGAIAGATRCIVTAPAGRKLIISDFTSIEAMVLPWVAGDDNILQMFRDGVDLYIDMAQQIFGVTYEDIVIGKDEKGDNIYSEPCDKHPGGSFMRQIGKIAILALGYGQGPLGYVSSCKNMGGVEIDEDFARNVVEAYRAANKPVTQFWRDVERAAYYCVRTGKRVRCGMVSFRMERKESQEWLVLRLPSGRDLYYHKPGLGTNKFDKRCVFYWGVRKGKYTRIDLYGGLLTENIVQAIARDLLADALLAADKRGVDIILHVHDELVAETDEDNTEDEQIVHECMTHVPTWADGLPLSAKTHTCKRYTK